MWRLWIEACKSSTSAWKSELAPVYTTIAVTLPNDKPPPPAGATLMARRPMSSPVTTA